MNTIFTAHINSQLRHLDTSPLFVDHKQANQDRVYLLHISQGSELAEAAAVTACIGQLTDSKTK